MIKTTQVTQFDVAIRGIWVRVLKGNKRLTNPANAPPAKKVAALIKMHATDFMKNGKLFKAGASEIPIKGVKKGDAIMAATRMRGESSRMAIAVIKDPSRVKTKKSNPGVARRFNSDKNTWTSVSLA